MNRTATARKLRREQTPEERDLWRSLRAGRFAGFKFRRQHPIGRYFLDFYCPAAKLSIELDGAQHGSPEQRLHDLDREEFLAALGIQELRFWNRHWREHREYVLLDIWSALRERTGSDLAKRRVEKYCFIPPRPEQVKLRPPLPSLSSAAEERVVRLLSR